MGFLLVTPSPMPTESLLGYTLRVSESNGYETPWHVLSWAGFEQGEMLTAGFPAEKLATVLARDSGSLEEISYRSSDKAGNFKLLDQPLGRSLIYSPLRLNKPSFCPHCVQENGFIDAFWDLRFAVACPDHGTVTLDKCPECSTALSWYRPGLLTCKCGADLGKVPTTSAAATTVHLMHILRAKGHGSPDAPKIDTNLPIQVLWNLSLRTLIKLISSLGKYSLSSANTAKPHTPLQIVSGAVDALQDWPTGYHALLRQLAKSPDQSTVSTASLRKRFEKLYSSLLKNGRHANEFSFLRDEFIRFGLVEWGDGIVDARMDIASGDKRRFVSRTELAGIIGIHQKTLRNWVDMGKISIKEVDVGNQKRYIADVTTVPIPESTSGNICQEREAAKFLGVPVSVLRSLKKSGHYVVKHMPAFSPGYHEADLADFRNRLLRKSPLLTEVAEPEDIVSLDYLMQELRFWSKDGKATVLADYLDGNIESIGRQDDRVQSILFKRAAIDSLASQCRANFSQGAISQEEAATLIGCVVQAIPGLVKRGDLIGHTGPARLRVTKKSVESFMSRQVSLLRLARELKSTVARLHRLCTNRGIAIISVAREKCGTSLFVEKSASAALIAAFNEACPIERQIPQESLLRYLEGLRQNKLPLPRKGLIPNKSAIANACSFDRSAFAKNTHVIQLINEFERDDAKRHHLQSDIKPIDRLKQYLNNCPALPLRKGKPNKLAIARACGLSRNSFYATPDFDELLSTEVRTRNRHAASSPSPNHRRIPQ